MGSGPSGNMQILYTHNISIYMCVYVAKAWHLLISTSHEARPCMACTPCMSLSGKLVACVLQHLQGYQESSWSLLKIKMTLGAIASALGTTWYRRRPSSDVRWCLAALQMHKTLGSVSNTQPNGLCIWIASRHHHEALQCWSGCRSGHDRSKHVILLFWLLVMHVFSPFVAMLANYSIKNLHRQNSPFNTAAPAEAG